MQRREDKRNFVVLAKELASLEAKLANTQFIQNAPAAVVQQAQARHTELRARIEKLMQNQ